MRALTALTLASLALLVGAGEACACTCVPPDPDAYLAKFDGAFVGQLVEIRSTQQGPAWSSAAPTTLVFEVEKVAKGDLPRRVEVVTAASSASCGVQAAVRGDPVGLFLEREGDEWHSGLCAQVAPGDLERAAERSGIALTQPRAGVAAAGPSRDDSRLIVAALVTLGLATAFAVMLRRRGRV